MEVRAQQKVIILSSRPGKNYTVNKGLKLTWEEKRSRAAEMQSLRNQLKDYKDEKLRKRK
jgi:hypothetical protein